MCRELTAELVTEVETCQPPLPSSVASHIARLVEYNVPKGKLNRGLTVVEAMEVRCRTATCAAAACAAFATAAPPPPHRRHRLCA